MLLTILLSLLQAAVPATPAPALELSPSKSALSGSKCPQATVRQAGEGEPLRPRRLDELPAGSLELTVMREVDGCPIPAVVQEGIGSGRRPVRR